MDPARSTPPDTLGRLADLVYQERRSLVATATREGLDAEEALECVQEALCTWLARHARGANSSETPLAAALRTMIKNAARNWRRRHRRLRPHSQADQEPSLHSAERDAQQLLEAAESALRLQSCVAELREVERAVVSLRLLDERSGEDVASLLGLSRSHVDVLVHRAKATLRVCMTAPNCARG